MNKKSIKLLLASAFVGLTIASCGGEQTSKEDLKDTNDSVSYAIGFANTQGIKQQLAMMEVDTTYIDEFIKGIKEGVKAKDDKKLQAYNTGVAFGTNLNLMYKGVSKQIFGGDSTKSLSYDSFVSGFIKGVKGGKNIVEMQEIQKLVEKMQSETFKPNIEKGQKFLNENKKKAGVVTLPNGLQYKVIKAGKGALPTDSTLITLNYEGKTIDGKVFDSTFGKEPTRMVPMQSIPGFKEALLKMPVGSTWEVYIPQELAYGSQGAGQDIQPYSTLIFKIEVLAFGKQ